MSRYRRIKNILKRINIFPQLYGALFGHKNYARFAIVSYARTGSNYLSDGIKSSKSVQMYHEIFAEHNREVGNDFDKVISRLYRRQGRRIENVGFKLFYYHLTDVEWEKFLSHKDISIIHLTRRNRLRTFVSLEIAFKTDKWTSGRKDLSLQSRIIRLNPNKLIKKIEEIEKYEKTAKERFFDRKMIEVVYEDVVKDPINEFMRIGKFLGITDIDLQKIHIRRQNPESLRDLIENFDEISKLLEKTRFAEYLYM